MGGGGPQPTATPRAPLCVCTDVRIELEQERRRRARYRVNPSANNDLDDTSSHLQSRPSGGREQAAAHRPEAVVGDQPIEAPLRRQKPPPDAGPSDCWCRTKAVTRRHRVAYTRQHERRSRMADGLGLASRQSQARLGALGMGRDNDRVEFREGPERDERKVADAVASRPARQVKSDRPRRRALRARRAPCLLGPMYLSRSRFRSGCCRVLDLARRGTPGSPDPGVSVVPVKKGCRVESRALL
jgi:hypothetical protein